MIDEQDDRMGADELVGEAIEKLYAVDPDEFTERRTALAAQARTTDKAAGKDIAALRKPTRSAYALNQLVRSDPEAATRLAQLGDDLRAAQAALDGARMRELSTLRRGMVEELADQAFHATGQRSPAPGLRDEVVSTLNAAVADQSVAQQLGSATLVKPARWDGFGFASPPELSVVRPGGANHERGRGQVVRPGGANHERGRGQAVRPGGANHERGQGQAVRPTTAKPKTGAATSSSTVIKGRKPTEVTKAEQRAQQRAADAAARAEVKAEEHRQRQVLVEAKRVGKEAGAALAAAAKAEAEQQTRVRLLHEQLTDARRRLDEMRIDLRRAENRERKAQQALHRQQK